ncbi:MAG TPA: hypothetical protein PK812_01955 [Beijerinckiaceae bacterium]|nr:hypothetical protein [Beijerinckiaceae bacterium]
MRRTWMAAVFVAMLTPVAAQTAQESIRPTGLALLPDTPKGHFGTPLPSTQFNEHQQRKLMLITFDKSAVGQTLNFAVRARSTTASAPAVVFRASATVNEQGLVPIEVKLPRKWPVGHYEVLVFQNDQPVGVLPYRVIADPPRETELSFGDVAIEKVTGPDQVEPVEKVRSSYRHLNFSVKVSGANTNGINLTWVFSAIETTSGSRELHRQDDANRPVEDTELQMDVSLPRDWPIGRYRVDLFVDGKPVVTRGFTIEP